MRHNIEDVTFVIPTFQRPAMLRRALESVSLQTLKPLNVVVASNGIDIQVREVIAEFRNLGLNIRLIETSEIVPAWKNWMNGFELVESRLIKIVWDDDWLEPDCIEELLELMNSSNARLVLCGAFGHVNGETYRWYNLPDKEVTKFEELSTRVFRRQIPNSPLAGLHFARDVVDAMKFQHYPIGAVTDSLVVGPDYAINLWALLKGHRTVVTSKALVHMFSDGENMTDINQNILPTYYKNTIGALIRFHKIALSLKSKIIFNAMPENNETIIHWCAKRLVNLRFISKFFS